MPEEKVEEVIVDQEATTQQCVESETCNHEGCVKAE